LKFKDPGVVQILVGLKKVGIAGLRSALKKAAASGLTEPQAIVDLLWETLEADNYFPEGQAERYCRALWREFLRHQGKEFTAFYSEIPVTVRGEPGPPRDRFVELLGAVLGEFELRPVVTYHPASADGPNPQLVVNGETVVRGAVNRRRLKGAIHRSISDW
jgi:hypothetical protein